MWWSEDALLLQDLKNFQCNHEFNSSGECQTINLWPKLKSWSKTTIQSTPTILILTGSKKKKKTWRGWPSPSLDLNLMLALDIAQADQAWKPIVAEKQLFTQRRVESFLPTQSLLVVTNVSHRYWQNQLLGLGGSYFLTYGQVGLDSFLSLDKWNPHLKLQFLFSLIQHTFSQHCSLWNLVKEKDCVCVGPHTGAW